MSLTPLATVDSTLRSRVRAVLSLKWNLESVLVPAVFLAETV
jgi:hypothetical protein